MSDMADDDIIKTVVGFLVGFNVEELSREERRIARFLEQQEKLEIYANGEIAYKKRRWD